MKSLLLAVTLCAAPALSQTPTLTPATKFDWKLRLTKGQKWTQSSTSRVHAYRTILVEGEAPFYSFYDVEEISRVKNEVLNVTPTFFLIRSTFLDVKNSVLVRLNGEAQPGNSLPSDRADIGQSIVWKQETNGRVTVVSGLQELLSHRRNAELADLKTPQERAALKRSPLPLAQFRSLFTTKNSVALPPTALDIGQSYAYKLDFVALRNTAPLVSVQRTLRSFDTQNASFQEGGGLVSRAGKGVVLKGSVTGRTLVQPLSGLVNNSILRVKAHGKTTALVEGKVVPVLIAFLGETTQTNASP